MASEEIGLAHALEADGLARGRDRPRRIHRPARRRSAVAHHRAGRPHEPRRTSPGCSRRPTGSTEPLSDDPRLLTAFARERLRDVFLRADVGICGVNFAVADTGSFALVTNEGNGRLVTSHAEGRDRDHGDGAHRAVVP